MEFSRQEYWSGFPFPFPGDLPDPEIESGSPALPELPGKPLYIYIVKEKVTQSCPWNSPGKNTGLCCHFLLQGIFLT